MTLALPKPDSKAKKLRKDAERLKSRQKFKDEVLAVDRRRCRNFLKVHDPKNPWHTKIGAHHIIYRGRLALDVVENGISLCAECHRRVHVGHGGMLGHRDMSSREYMLWILDQLKDFPDFRWGKARAELQKSVDRKKVGASHN